jgi:hypothetical protein
MVPVDLVENVRLIVILAFSHVALSYLVAAG